MSPRRRVEPGGRGFAELPPKRRRSVLMALWLGAATLLTAAAIAVSVTVFVVHQRHHQAAVRDIAVTDFVRAFMTHYTSPDPFHANDYADAVLAQATGPLAQMYREKLNEIVVQVARAEPTQGSVLDAGIERWNDDGSATVVVATQTTTKLPDGKAIQNGIRWVTTAIQEGGQWKISNLLQVI